jgi:two-component system sensor histidine kinase MprB
VSASAVAVTVCLIAIVVYLGARSQILGPIDESLGERAVASSEVPSITLPGFTQFNPDGTVRSRGPRLPREISAAFGNLGAEFDATYVQIIGSSSVFNIGSDSLVLPAPPTIDGTSEQPAFRSTWVSGTHLRIATVASPDGDFVVQVARPLTEADESLHRIALMMIFTGGFGILLAGGLGLVVARSAVKPIEDLEHAVEGIARSQAIDERLDVRGSDEVAQLASAFNELLDELKAAKVQQTRLVRDAGHELRTPLTSLRTNLELLQRHEVEPAERRRMVDAAHAEVQELSALVSEVVDLATDRYEDEPVSMVVLSEVASSVAERQHRRNGRDVIVEADDSTVEGKPAALDRALTNIVSNADKWSPVGAAVVVTITAGTVTVQDRGEGFLPTDLEHVFERFFRSDVARATPGSGLGLSIVAQIVKDHGGEVFARNRSEGSGAEVGFFLPVEAS